MAESKELSYFANKVERTQFINKLASSSSDGEEFSAEDKDKLSGISEGATKNITDASLRARSGHTGSQAISTITGLQAALLDLQGRLEALEGA